MNRIIHTHKIPITFHELSKEINKVHDEGAHSALPVIEVKVALERVIKRTIYNSVVSELVSIIPLRISEKAASMVETEISKDNCFDFDRLPNVRSVVIVEKCIEHLFKRGSLKIIVDTLVRHRRKPDECGLLLTIHEVQYTNETEKIYGILPVLALSYFCWTDSGEITEEGEIFSGGSVPEVEHSENRLTQPVKYTFGGREYDCITIDYRKDR